MDGWWLDKISYLQLCYVIISMNKEALFANRALQRKDVERTNQMLMQKLMSIKFSNISALKAPLPQKKLPRPHNIDVVKFTVSSDHKQRRVKTVLEGDRIKVQNKVLYGRLVNQKSTIPTKLLAESRQKNLEYLRRIGRYPYRRNFSVVEDPVQQGRSSKGGRRSEHRPHRTQYSCQDDSSQILNVRSITDQSSNTILSNHILQESRREHKIVLFSKVIQLSKSWFRVKIVRFKSSYQLSLLTYPYGKVEYSLRLGEEIGTAMLSENDYDYVHICERFIKMTHQYVCFSFEVAAPERKKYFYRFEKKVMPTVGEEEEKGEEEEGGEEKEEQKNGITEQDVGESGESRHRMTMFALENERKQKELLLQNQRRMQLAENFNSKKGRLDLTQVIDIKLSGSEV